MMLLLCCCCVVVVVVIGLVIHYTVSLQLTYLGGFHHSHHSHDGWAESQGLFQKAVQVGHFNYLCGH